MDTYVTMIAVVWLVVVASAWVLSVVHRRAAVPTR
jgi:hypothetical protein